ncbi:MAG: CPBP family intramembrane glutamic endopeptidase [Acidimicrobiia bacterium]
MPSDSIMRRWWRRHIVDVQTGTDAASAAYLAVTPVRVANRKAAIVLLTAPLVLTSLNYGTAPDWLVSLLDGVGLDGFADRAREVFFTSGRQQFNTLMFWGVIEVLSYVLIPMLVIKLVLRERVVDYGLRAKGIFRQGGTYVLLFAASLPFILLASTTAGFQAKYPFYELSPGEAIWPRMVIWWLVYAAQFLGLEFFFRGFLVHGLKWRLGYMAVFAMIVPYNMLHYQKPVLEALAAIVGGWILGSLSLKTRSIWWGAMLHVGVAGTMDLLSLSHKGLL